MIKNSDLKQFKFALEEYSQISDLSYERYYSLKLEIKDLEQENNNGENNNEIEKLKEEYSDSSQFQNYRRQVLLGIKYWILFLYQINKLEKSITLEFIKLINIQYYDSEDTIDDILFFRSRKSQSFMGWDNWDYTERKSGVYSPPTPQYWLTLGFLIDQIREGDSFVNIENYHTEDLHEAKYLHDEFKKEIGNFVENFDYWKEILNVENIENLREKSDKILSFYAALKRKTIGKVEKEIEAEPLSEEKIKEFKKNVGITWKKNARVRQLFTEKGVFEDNIKDDIVIKPIGHRVFYEKAKFVFIDGEHYQKIYGIESLGGRIGRWEDDKFFNTIITGDHKKIFETNTLQILINAIAELKEKGYTPDLILISSLYNHKDRELFNSSNFIPKKLLPLENSENTLSLLGKFDGIPVYSSLSEFIKNRILVCDFKAAFKMKHKVNPDWFEGELKVDVNLITEDEANKRLTEQPDKWIHTEDGIDLSKEDALTLIKTSVNIDCWSTIEFEILNQDAYLMGYVKIDNK